MFRRVYSFGWIPHIYIHEMENWRLKTRGDSNLCCRAMLVRFRQRMGTDACAQTHTHTHAHNPFYGINLNRIPLCCILLQEHFCAYSHTCRCLIRFRIGSSSWTWVTEVIESHSLYRHSGWSKWHQRRGLDLRHHCLHSRCKYTNVQEFDILKRSFTNSWSWVVAQAFSI